MKLLSIIYEASKHIAYLTTYIENQTLLQRLGDLRNSEAAGVKSDGFWMKGFGGKLSAFSGSTMKGFDMTYTGTQLGIDKNIDIQDGRLLVGIMAGFTRALTLIIEKVMVQVKTTLQGFMQPT